MNNFFCYDDVNFFTNFTNFLQSREQTNAKVAKSVSSIIDDVKVNKDFAVIKYTKRFDNINLDSKGFFYKPIEIKESIDKCSSKDKDAIELSISRIIEFHKKKSKTIGKTIKSVPVRPQNNQKTNKKTVLGGGGAGLGQPEGLEIPPEPGFD